MSDPGTQAFARFASACPHRRELAVERRSANALNVEIGSAAARCALKTPAHWPDGFLARWIGSGGTPLVLGACSRNCALGQKWCAECGHREDSHIGGVCRVTRDGEAFPCGCEADRCRGVAA